MTELRALRARVNALRRKMAPALAVVKARRAADAYCHDWFVLRRDDQLPPDPQRLIQALLRDGLRLPSFPAAYNFLNDCRRRNTNPAPHRLVKVLLPWARPCPP